MATSKVAARPSKAPGPTACRAPRTKAMTSSSGARVRCRFLRSIGITRPSTPTSKTTTKRGPRLEGGARPSLRAAPRRSERLRYRHDRREDERREPHESGEGGRKKSVSFGEVVAVVMIPMRQEYSDRIRTRLWTAPPQMLKNAMRNFVEYAAEGRDWRSVCLEEEMHPCVDTGELVHPVHLESSDYAFEGGMCRASERVLRHGPRPSR